ncbi:MAG: GatB/YqeY domain-containing protein [Nitriliruptorales bacterium]|nr:GatB/YqeY domain-containing protein [Nitriliruptorales bacterium]
MSLSDQIQSDLTTAMKARDTERVATLRMIVAAIKNLRVAVGHSGEVTDTETQSLLTREAKKRNEAADAYANAGREDLAGKERRELAIVRTYLPEQLGEDELAAIVDEVVAETGASSPSDLGRVMSSVMPRVRGRADGKQVSALVRHRLGA